MKVAGVDYGRKRIGIAVSDERGTIAFPHAVVLNGRDTVGAIADIISKEGAEAVVVGESLDQQGRENPIAADIARFVEALGAATGVPIHTEQEFFTSAHVAEERWAAEQESGRRPKAPKGNIDASAAALILQRYLDRVNAV